MGVIKINKTDIQRITDMAESLVSSFHTRDPFQICDGSGILVRFKDIGDVKGIYTYYKRNRFVVVNTSLCDTEKKIVCAHELGHDMLHRAIMKNANLYDKHLYDFSLKPEFEANIFAAELLISDSSVISNMEIFTDISSLSGELCVSESLLKLKCAIMKNRGIDLQYSGDYDFNIF